jgi:hypothetical protein
MQIQLKQSEIIAAIKQYVVNQGISLNGKTVDITFSATRGAAGIIADVSIEEVSIPGFSDSPAEDAAKPALTVVSSTEPGLKAASEEATAEVKQPAEATEAAPAKATSLFN